MSPRLAIAFVLLVSLAVAPTANARIEGPCTARIGGEDVSQRNTGPLSDAIQVDRDSPVSVTMSSARPIQSLEVEIEFAGLRWPVHERSTTGTSWASEVPVHDYAVYGIGLYKVVASSAGDGFTCEGAALVSVAEGDDELAPLVTVTGLVGFALALMGALGVLANASGVGRGRARPAIGLVFGAILGVGVLALLQQFAVLYPTVSVAGAILAAGAALGLGFSLFGLPSRPSDAQS
jgi:hypothetical protein